MTDKRKRAAGRPSGGGRWARAATALVLQVQRRFFADRGPHIAAALSYTSCLALVPLLAIGLATLATLPVFAGLREQLQSFVFEVLLPPTGGAEVHISRFIGNIGQLTAVGVGGLTITAIMLLATIEDAFNHIFRVRERRPWLIRLLTFWTILTLGPLLFGASLSVSAELIAALESLEVDSWLVSVGGFAGLISTLFAFLGFTLVYAVIPHRPVAWRDAMAGALVAALLFNLLKKGFALYLAAAPVYETVYGALAAVPIFLVWMYLSWAVVVAGAELVAALPEWRMGLVTAGPATPPGQRLSLAVVLLADLLDAVGEGRRPLRRGQLLRRLPFDEATLDGLLRDLRRARIVERTATGGWVVVPESDRITLYDLYRALGLGITPEQVRPLFLRGRNARLGAILEAVEREVRTATGRPLRDILEEARGAEAPEAIFSRAG